MRLILMRHGKPKLDLEALRGHWMTAAEVAELIDRYEQSGLDEAFDCPVAQRSLAAQSRLALVSPLPRTQQSLARLELGVESCTDPVFLETVMAKPRLPYGLRWIRLPVLTWFSLLRLGWYLRLLNGKESFSACRKRAEQAAMSLESAVRSHDTVLLSGHGLFNVLIGKALIKRGWQQIQTNGHGYWAMTVYDLAKGEEEPPAVHDQGPGSP